MIFDLLNDREVREYSRKLDEWFSCTPQGHVSRIFKAPLFKRDDETYGNLSLFFKTSVYLWGRGKTTLAKLLISEGCQATGPSSVSWKINGLIPIPLFTKRLKITEKLTWPQLLQRFEETCPAPLSVNWQQWIEKNEVLFVVDDCNEFILGAVKEGMKSNFWIVMGPEDLDFENKLEILAV